MNRFRQWLREVILEWRRVIEELPSGEILPPCPIYKFQAPCQIDIVRVFHSYHRLDYRMCVVRHFADEPDLKITVFRPYYPNQAAAAVEAYVNQPKWQRLMPDDKNWQARGRTYGEELASTVGNAYANLQIYLNNTVQSSQIEGRDFGSIRLAGDIFAFGIAGRIETVGPDPATYIRDRVERDLEAASRSKQTSSVQVKVKRSEGLGAFLLPGTWIGEAPSLSLSQHLQQTRPEGMAHQRVVLSSNYQGSPLTVTQSGYLCLGITDRDEAASRINEILAAALFSDIPAFAISPTDLIVSSDLESPLTSFTIMGEGRAEQLTRLNGNGFFYGAISETEVVPIHDVERILATAADISQDATASVATQLCL